MGILEKFGIAAVGIGSLVYLARAEAAASKGSAGNKAAANPGAPAATTTQPSGGALGAWRLT